MRLHHFYHVYADGAWAEPVTEHCHALTRYGLYDELDSLHVGFVGSADNIAAARATLDVLVPKYRVCSTAEFGWEQVTLNELLRWCRRRGGLVAYAHTKGASRVDAIDPLWRREMTYYNFVQWQVPVGLLVDGGKTIAGCHWIRGGESSVAGYGTGGMFGGNFWWARCDAVRVNDYPTVNSRFDAEHWLGMLSERMPITDATIGEMHPHGPDGIGIGPDWDWS